MTPVAYVVTLVYLLESKLSHAEIFSEIDQPWWTTILAFGSSSNFEPTQSTYFPEELANYISSPSPSNLKRTTYKPTQIVLESSSDYQQDEVSGFPGFPVSRQKYLDNLEGLDQVLFESAQLALAECQRISKYLLWTCPLKVDPLSGVNTYKFNYKQNTREFSFVSTLNSAALLYKIRDGCLSGQLKFCDCSNPPERSLNETHLLINDCSEFHRVPRDIARRFTDKPLLPPMREFYLETAVILHNYLVGRKQVEKLEKSVCRCSGTGVSGSCSHKICWNMVDFAKVATSIRTRYSNALQVKLGNEFSRRKQLSNLVLTGNPFKPAKKNQMVYSSSLSEYSCHQKGQVCQSQDPQQCARICCSGKFEVVSVIEEVECNCEFDWCCTVKCEVCHPAVNYTYCA